MILVWLKTSAWVGVSETIVIEMHGETVKFNICSVWWMYTYSVNVCVNY